MTTVTANTNLSFNKSHSFSRSRSARFNNDPYTITNDEDPLDNVFDKDFSAEYMPELFKATINRNSNSSKSQGNSYSFGLNGMAVRRLNSKGRNVSFDFALSSGDGQNKSFRIADIYYYKRAADKRHTFQDQYTSSPSHNWSYRERISYSEPIVKGLRFQTSYAFYRSKVAVTVRSLSLIRSTVGVMANTNSEIFPQQRILCNPCSTCKTPYTPLIIIFIIPGTKALTTTAKT